MYYMASHLMTGIITAAASTGSSLNDPLTYLTGLGFPGIIIMLLITGQLRTKAEVERLIAELNHKDEVITLKDQQIKALQEGIVDKAIPALTRSTQVLEQLPQSVQNTENQVLDQLLETSREVSKLSDKIARLTRRSQDD